VRRGAALGLLLLTAAGCSAPERGAPPATSLGALPVWDDGLAEICYYDATRVIYGEPRRYTRVHLFNREWFDTAAGVKTEHRDAPAAVAVFKLNIAEEIPTENYNYRFLTTLFIDRAAMKPYKLVSSSQEWCGATYKHLRWSPAGLELRSFSYFEGEAEQAGTAPAEALPQEALFVLARQWTASGAAPRSLELLPAMRGSHGVEPQAQTAAVEDEGVQRARSGAGSIDVRVFRVQRGDETQRFRVDTEAPFRVVSWEGPGETMSLRRVERRAYWDRSSRSREYRPGQAP